MALASGHGIRSLSKWRAELPEGALSPQNSSIFVDAPLQTVADRGTVRNLPATNATTRSPSPGGPSVLNKHVDRSDPKAALTSKDVLRQLAAPHRYRVALDAEGWPLIPGKLGHLEWHDGTTLAVYTDRPRLFARLWAIPNVRPWQVGDQEVRGLVALDMFRGGGATHPGPPSPTPDPGGGPKTVRTPHGQGDFSGVGRRTGAGGRLALGSGRR